MQSIYDEGLRTRCSAALFPPTQQFDIFGQQVRLLFPMDGMQTFSRRNNAWPPLPSFDGPGCPARCSVVGSVVCV